MPIAKYAIQNLTPPTRKKRTRGFGGGLWKPKPGQGFSPDNLEDSANPRIEETVNPRIEQQQP